MAYELTFVQGSPGRSYSSTSKPSIGNNGAINSSQTFTIKFADDDDHLNEVSTSLDATPATLLEDLTLTIQLNSALSRAYTYPAGTPVALSPPAYLKLNDGSYVHMQGLLVQVDGAWQPIVPIKYPNEVNYPGLYIFTDASPDYPDPETVVNLPPSITVRTSFGTNTHHQQIPYNGQPDGGPGNPGDVTCFTPGSLIDTPTGPRRVEDLLPGDMVQTRDHGPQPLIWVGRRQIGADQIAAAPRLRPIRIAAGALGPNIPCRDLVVSPQHRLLLRSRILSRVTGEAEVLTPANQLLGWPGVEVLPAATGVTYLHLACAHHEVIRADGAWTETLYAGPELRKARSPMAQEIAVLFPRLMAPDAPLPAPARPLLRGKPLREVARRAAKNRRDLVEAEA